MASTPPNQSLYLQNLPLNLPKPALKRELYTLFTTHGPVVDVNALKTTKMRGQAHVLFRDVNSASAAMRGCQGMEFFGREMRISYSKNRSNVLAKLTGTVNQPLLAAATAGGIAQPPTGFPAPPGALPPPPGTLPAPPAGLPPPPSGLPPKVNGELKAPAKVEEDVASPQGVKRLREESDDEDAAMDEDGEEEDEGEMEMSDED